MPVAPYLAVGAHIANVLPDRGDAHTELLRDVLMSCAMDSIQYEDLTRHYRQILKALVDPGQGLLSFRYALGRRNVAFVQQRYGERVESRPRTFRALFV